MRFYQNGLNNLLLEYTTYIKASIIILTIMGLNLTHSTFNVVNFPLGMRICVLSTLLVQRAHI